MNYKKKNPFDAIEDTWRDGIVAMDEKDIRNAIATTALAQAELMAAKLEDEDLKEKKEAVKEASAIYREGTKINKLKIAFAHQILADRGKA